MFSFGKPSKRQFADQLREAIAQVEKDRRYEFDAENFRLLRQGGGAEVNLTNIYKEHCAVPKDERSEHLARIASIVCSTSNELPESFEEAKPNLRPKIWNRSTFAMLELKQRVEGGQTLDLPLYPVGSHLCSSLVYDTESSMRAISNEDLEKWGVTYYEALEVACRNLEETTIAFAKIGDHFHSSVTGDNYDSSRVLLIDRIRSFEVKGEYIACVPQRDAMFVAGSLDELSLKIMFDLTEQSTAEDERPLCPLPLKLKDDEWVDWEPPKNHVLRGRYDAFELAFLGSLYTEQKELLDELLAREEGNPPFVASFSVVKEQDSEKLHSYCLWSKGVDSLLPRTQVAVFADGGGIRASGEWAHVMSIVGHLVTADQSHYPTCYRVQQFPNDEELVAIGTTQPFVGED